MPEVMGSMTFPIEGLVIDGVDAEIKFTVPTMRLLEKKFRPKKIFQIFDRVQDWSIDEVIYTLHLGLIKGSHPTIEEDEVAEVMDFGVAMQMLAAIGKGVRKSVTGSSEIPKDAEGNART